jgi:fluoride exporter
MDDAVIFVLVCLAGAVGAVARFVADGAIRARVGSAFPWATLSINVSGSLLLGILTGLVVFRHTGGDARLLLGTGFCGGYTTFSTAMFESVRLLQQGSVLRMLGNWLGTMVLTMAAAAVGLVLVH